MPAQRCPACGLVNPATAERCDCGRSFIDGSQGEPLRAGPRDRRGTSPGWYVALGSFVLLLLGLLVVSTGSTEGGAVLGVLGIVGINVGRIWVRAERG